MSVPRCADHRVIEVLGTGGELAVGREYRQHLVERVDREGILVGERRDAQRRARAVVAQIAEVIRVKLAVTSYSTTAKLLVCAGAFAQESCGDSSPPAMPLAVQLFSPFAPGKFAT